MQPAGLGTGDSGQEKDSWLRQQPGTWIRPVFGRGEATTNPPPPLAPAGEGGGAEGALGGQRWRRLAGGTFCVI